MLSAACTNVLKCACSIMVCTYAVIYRCAGSANCGETLGTQLAHFGTLGILIGTDATWDAVASVIRLLSSFTVCEDCRKNKYCLSGGCSTPTCLSAAVNGNQRAFTACLTIICRKSTHAGCLSVRHTAILMVLDSSLPEDCCCCH